MDSGICRIQKVELAGGHEFGGSSKCMNPHSCVIELPAQNSFYDDANISQDLSDYVS